MFSLISKCSRPYLGSRLNRRSYCDLVKSDTIKRNVALTLYAPVMLGTTYIVYNTVFPPGIFDPDFGVDIILIMGTGYGLYNLAEAPLSTRDKTSIFLFAIFGAICLYVFSLLCLASGSSEKF